MALPAQAAVRILWGDAGHCDAPVPISFTVSPPLEGEISVFILPNNAQTPTLESNAGRAGGVVEWVDDATSEFNKKTVN